MAMGGVLGDQYAALVGLSHTKVFNVTEPDTSQIHNRGGSRATWIKNHKLLLCGNNLVCLEPTHGEAAEFFTSSKIELVAVHPVNPNFYAYTSDNKLLFYDMSLRFPTHTIPLQASIPLLTSIVVCPDSQKLVATTIDGRMMAWSLLSGYLVNNQLITDDVSLVKIQALGHGAFVVLDKNGYLYYMDLARQWLHLLEQPILGRNNLVYNNQRGVLCSSFSDHVEVFRAMERRVIDMSKFGEIIDMGVNREGTRLLACHSGRLTSWSLDTRGFCWQRSIDQVFMGQKQLAVIPFCS